MATAFGRHAATIQAHLKATQGSRELQTLPITAGRGQGTTGQHPEDGDHHEHFRQREAVGMFHASASAQSPSPAGVNSRRRCRGRD